MMKMSEIRQHKLP